MDLHIYNPNPVPVIFSFSSSLSFPNILNNLILSVSLIPIPVSLIEKHNNFSSELYLTLTLMYPFRVNLSELLKKFNNIYLSLAGSVTIISGTFS